MSRTVLLIKKIPLFQRCWRELIVETVQTPGIAEELNVIQHFGMRISSGAAGPTLDAFAH